MSSGFKKGWLLLIFAVAFLFFGEYIDSNLETPSVRRPPIALPPLPESKRGEDPVVTGPALPAASSRDPTFEVETGEKFNSTGTAFTIRDDGIWLTARHVVVDCDRVGIVARPGLAIEVRRTLSHPRADIAVLWTGARAPALAISHDALHIGQSGFHIGFPQSEPGQVSSSLLGRRNMRTIGRYRYTEPVVAWAEKRRVPDTETLGGISGGPALNAKGEIVGVTVASSLRRGRVMTTAPVSIDGMLSMAGVRPSGLPSAGLRAAPRAGNFIDHGNALRRQLTVAKVICRVDDAKRRRRP